MKIALIGYGKMGKTIEKLAAIQGHEIVLKINRENAKELTIENSHIDYIQTNHYIDEGCLCKACILKRGDVASKIMKGIHNNERIIHNNAKQELINKRAAQVNKINAAIQKIPVNNTNKNYRSTIKNISAIMGSRR